MVSLAPILLGTAVATFFNGAEFIGNKEQLTDIGHARSFPRGPILGTDWKQLSYFGIVCLGLAVFLPITSSGTALFHQQYR
jgi:cytochrome d ubiquinol oxidase subunit II